MKKSLKALAVFNIIAGHGRIMAAKAEGMTEVPCVFVQIMFVGFRNRVLLADAK